MITKTGIYGIRAMLALAKLPAGESAGASRIAEVVDVPQSYLSKLLQILAREGLVISQRGVGGGFQLGRDARDISLYDLIVPLERLERWNACILGNAVCSEQSPCALHSRWKAVQKSYLNMLRNTSLAELADLEPLTEQELEQILS